MTDTEESEKIRGHGSKLEDYILVGSNQDPWEQEEINV